jgi:hypothetical protein
MARPTLPALATIVLLGAWFFPAPAAADVTRSASTPPAPRLTIVSDTNCPSGSEVADALAALRPLAEWPSGTVRIQATDDMLVVDMRPDESRRRRLRVAADCGERASTVALIIATWTGELSSDAARAPVLLGQPAGTDGQAVATPASPPAHATTSTERALGAGLFLALSDGVAAGLRIDFAQTRNPSGLGWQAGLSLPTQRERAAAVGTSGWTRAAADVTLNGRVNLGRLALSADAGVAGAYTFTSGHGYTVDQGAQSLTGGFVAGTRLSLPWQRMCIWTDVRAYKWLFPQTVVVDSTSGERLATVSLPSSDFQWAIGVSYLLR